MTPTSKIDTFFKLGLGLLAWVVLGWLVLKVADYLLAIVVLFGMSLMFTYLLLAPVNVMETSLSKGIQWITRVVGLGFLYHRVPSLPPRALAILLVYLGFALMMIIVSVRFMPLAAEQLNQFSHQFPSYIHQVEEWVLSQPVTHGYFHDEVASMKSAGQLSRPQAQQLDAEAHNGDTEKTKPLSPTEKQVIREKLFITTDHINHFIKNHIASTFSNLFTLLSTTLTGFVYTLTGLVLIFYFLLDGRDLKEGFMDILPRDVQPSANYLLTNMHQAMFGFVKGQVMLGMATGVYMMIVYSLFDVPYALFLGAFFAVSEIIPVVGTWLGFLPGILVLLFINPIKLLFVMGLVYVYQVIKDNLVAPRVLGQAVGLHPVIVIVSLLVCAKIAGLVGVLFAIPLASMINVVLRFLQKKELETYSI